MTLAISHHNITFSFMDGSNDKFEIDFTSAIRDLQQEFELEAGAQDENNNNQDATPPVPITWFRNLNTSEEAWKNWAGTRIVERSQRLRDKLARKDFGEQEFQRLQLFEEAGNNYEEERWNFYLENNPETKSDSNKKSNHPQAMADQPPKNLIRLQKWGLECGNSRHKLW